MKFYLGTIDWAAIAAIVSALMVFFTWRSLKHNKSQLNELKRQWEEQNKPKIIPYISKSDGQGFLIIKNYSPIFINEVTIKLEVIGEAKLDWLDKLLPKLVKSQLNLEPFGSKSLLINYQSWAEAEYAGVLKVTILIEGKVHNNFMLDLSEWNVVMSSNTNDEMVKSIKEISSKLGDIKNRM